MPPSSLELHLGYWLRLVSNQVSNAFGQRLATCGVTVAEWVVLRELLRMETMAPSDLANRMGMTRGAITKLADRLIAKGLIVRTADNKDKRFQWLALTAAGQDLLPDLAALADENDLFFFGHLTPTERQTIETVLKGIADRQNLEYHPID